MPTFATIGLGPQLSTSQPSMHGQAYGIGGIVILTVPNSRFILPLSPNPPKDTDGRREDSGSGVGEGATGEMAWGLGADGRPADGLQSPHRAPKSLCGSCDARDGERIRSRGLSRPGWREIAGTLGQLQAGRQAGNGMACSRAKARLNWGSQGQRRGRCKVRRRAERVIRPTRAKTRRLRVLVIHGPLAQTNPRRPAGQVMRHHLDRQPGAVGGDDRPPVPASPHRGR